MGKESMSKYGTLFVTQERPVYAPGDQVNGVIYVDCFLDFPASHITLKLEGKEKVKYWVPEQVHDHTDKDGVKHYKTEYHPRWDSHRCFNYEFPAANFAGPFIPKGQYQIPFQFHLPVELPSTFHYKWHDGGDCFAKIHYKAKAKLESSTGKDLLKTSFDMILNASQNELIQQRRIDIDKEVINCCCFNQGRFKMTAYFEKDAYMPGETAFLVVEAENNSKAECKKIRGNFTQAITIKNGYGHKKDLTSVVCPGLAPGKTYLGQDAKRLEIPLTGTMITGGEDAGVSNTTVHGKLIQCNYYVSAQTEMDACICCDEHPVSRIYINQYNAVPPIPHVFHPPTDWAPQVFDTYIANFNPEFEIEIEVEV